VPRCDFWLSLNGCIANKAKAIYRAHEVPSFGRGDMHSGPIHKRSITIDTFELDDNTLVVEGTLIDDRLCRSFIYLLNAFVDPKIIHHMTVRMAISLPFLTIKSVHTEMHEVPHDACRAILDIGDKLVGISLLRKFNENTRDLIGGKNGCLHMHNLLTSMRAAAFQGVFTYYSRVQEDGSLRRMYFDESLLVNSCHVWSDSGPMIEEMKNVVKLVGMKK